VRPAAGSSLLEVVILLGVMAAILHAVAPEWVRWRQRQQVEGAADELALLVAALRVRSASVGVAFGVRFRADPPDLEWDVLRDGDGDGIRSDDARRGVDPVVAGPHVLSTKYRGVSVGLPVGLQPPAGGVRPTDGVAFGRADLLAVHPRGTTSSGSIYLCDAWGRCAAVRLHGVSGRIAVWARAPDQSVWTLRR
jgi:hypothetical protein